LSKKVPDIKAMLERTGPFPPQAYEFVRSGLAHTVSLIHGNGSRSDDDSRHVSGQQLCIGLKDFAVKQYGLLARTVLSKWNITTTEDFGRIVFGMISAGLMRKTDEDTMDDFRLVFDFDEAFGDLPVGKM